MRPGGSPTRVPALADKPPVAPEPVQSIIDRTLGLLGGGADLLACLGHHFFESLAGFSPGPVGERDVTTALSLAVVLAGVGPAAALAAAGVVPLAGMGFGRRALALPGAGVALALPQVLAGVEAAADVR